MTLSHHDGAHRSGAARAVLHARSLLVATFAAALVLLGALPAPGLPTDVTTDAEDATDVTVELTSQTPDVLSSPDDTLSVTVTVRNPTDQPLAAPSATLGVNPWTLDTRSQLSRWVESGTVFAAATPVSGSTTDLDPLGPGEATTVTFTAAPAELGLSGFSAWGPRALSVTLSDGGARVAVLRSFLLWAPQDTTSPVRLSVLAPFVGPPVDPLDLEATDDLVAAQVGPDDRLGRLLTATADVPEVSWVVDPTVLALAQDSGDPTARTWATDLLEAAEGRDTFALDPYDPDLAAFAHAEASPRTGVALPGGVDPTEGWRTDLWWPADDVPDQVTIQLAAEEGKEFVVVRGDALVPAATLTYTPTGLAQVAADTDPTTALVAEPVLTGLLSGTGLPSRTGGSNGAGGPDGAGGEPTTASTTQRLLAETATIARERPADLRHLLAALPRSGDVDTERLGAHLAALRDAPWVDLTGVGELLDSPIPDVVRSSLPAVEVADGEISRTDLRSLRRSRAELVDFASITADPAAQVRPFEPAFVAPAGIGYRQVTTVRDTVIQQVDAAVARQIDSIEVAPGSDINLISATGQLPVRVRNALDQDVTVRVALLPDDPRLSILQQPQTTVPAGGEAQVDVPVRAIGSGNVTVDVEVLSLDGTVVAQPAEFVVRVRADWESVGTAIVAVLLTVGLVAGVWRTIRRGRSPRRAAGATVDQPAPAPATTTEEEAP
ncbi:DUF6049 family protein [Oerskovia flava]|uniref:DUF6049 family protein n=1 Tax=Oerskovia flava TaxID=2986422 RepID=UPI00223F857A|nr:DUF6049 family protein [Oerskovia sp. JB1-3-2]